jgi:hypothetical protein
MHKCASCTVTSSVHACGRVRHVRLTVPLAAHFAHCGTTLTVHRADRIAVALLHIHLLSHLAFSSAPAPVDRSDSIASPPSAPMSSAATTAAPSSLECAICFEPFDYEREKGSDSAKLRNLRITQQPHVLPCAHSFCAGCIKKLIASGTPRYDGGPRQRSLMAVYCRRQMQGA